LKSEKLGKRNLVNINSFNVSFDFLNFQSKFGKLRFLKNISLLRQISIGKNMYFQKNYVFINSSDLPELNISAEVVMENVTFIQPRILKNGELCSISNCQLISFMNNTLIFNVSGFSIYEVEETPTCSDGIQNQDETGVDCGGSCSACNVGGGGGGGSGGGGGGSNDDDDDGDKFELDYIMNNTENLSCEEDYICYNWSSCENGFKTKECIVTSNCSSIVKKERISCSVEIFDNSTIGISPYLIYMEKNSNGLFFTNVDLKGSNFVYFNSSNELGDNFEFYGEVNGVYYLASYNFTDSFGRKVYLLNILDSNNSLEMGLNGNSSDILDEKFDLSDLTFFGKNLNYTYLSFGLVFVVLFILFLIFVVRKLHVSKDVGNNGLNYVYDDLELRNIYEYIGKYKEEYSIEELKEMLLKYNYKLEKIELVLKNMGLK
ncbi:MAG: hypothetical protein KC550_06860, partial [Nanoarchaeota archaeon]|nr:hypothetical protein [Nanoarchaeota archaeon]